MATTLWKDPNVEHTIWKGKSSQIVNFPVYFFCGLTFWLVIPLLYMFCKWLDMEYKHYELTTERLRIYSGVITKRIDDLELYRVKDSSYVEPFFLRLYKYGSIELRTSDASHPGVIIEGVRDGLELREKIRKAVEAARERKGVKEVDYYTIKKEM